MTTIAIVHKLFDPLFKSTFTSLPTYFPTQFQLAMATPFDQAYDSRDEMLLALRNHAISQGYTITTIRSNPDRNICIGCDRGGQYTDRINVAEGAKCRKTSTRRIGCSFHLYASKSNIKVINPDHNHELEDNMIAHPATRTITQELQAKMYYHLDENIPP